MRLSTKKAGAVLIGFALLLSTCSASMFAKSDQINIAIMVGGNAVAFGCLAFMVVKHKSLRKYFPHHKHHDRKAKQSL